MLRIITFNGFDSKPPFGDSVRVRGEIIWPLFSFGHPEQRDNLSVSKSITDNRTAKCVAWVNNSRCPIVLSVP
jgi:hypothetical protein